MVDGVPGAPPGAGAGEEPAASRSATMAWTVRSVSPTTALISRIRAPGLGRSPRAPVPVPGQKRPAATALVRLAHNPWSYNSREKEREIFLMFLLTDL